MDRKKVGFWGHVLVALGCVGAAGLSFNLADTGTVGAYIALFILLALGSYIGYYVVTHWRRG